MPYPRYRLNVDFDNTLTPFLYNGTGSFAITVPASPNFPASSPTRYVVFLPCVMFLSDVSKIPAIAGLTRVETSPGNGNFRTIPAAAYNTYLLKDAIEFNSAQAGSTYTVTNLYTIGSTIPPDVGASFLEDKTGCQLYTTRSTGVNSDLNLGVLKIGQGLISVNGGEIVVTGIGTVTISADLTNGTWYVFYMDNAGTITYEATTATDYTQMPIAQLDSKAPVNSSMLARYKSGDVNNRVIGLAYTLPATGLFGQTAYAAGTAYVRGNTCSYSGNIYVCILASTGNLPTNTTYWVLMGAQNRVFYPKVFNLPESTFGSGALGDVSLDGTGLGATATPFYANDGVGASEYEFNNLTLTGICYCGSSAGTSLAPVIIRVRGTLTIGASGQLNGDARGASGGAGGAGGTTSNGSTGGAGGAGAKSGRPISIYANKIVDQRASGYWLTTKAGNPSAGGAGTTTYNSYGGGGGAGGGSSSGIIIITNSQLQSFKNYNGIIASDFVSGGAGGISAGSAGAGAGGSSYGYQGSSGGSTGTGFGSTTTYPAFGGVGRGPGLGGLGGGSTDSSGIGHGGGGGSGICGGGGGGGGSGAVGIGGIGGTGGTGTSPAISHMGLDYVTVIDRYDGRGSI